jgi:lipoate-protein ligase A
MMRRFTGGGTILVDHNTVFSSLICNIADSLHADSIAVAPREIMKWTNTHIFQPAFSHHLSPLAAEHFDLNGHDYVLRRSNRKIAGNAQAISKLRFVHHTSWLWHFDIDTISRYLRLPPASSRPEYRGDRSHRDFLASISPYYSSSSSSSSTMDGPGSASPFIDDIVRSLHSRHEIEFLTPAELMKAMKGDFQPTSRMIHIGIDNAADHTRTITETATDPI